MNANKIALVVIAIVAIGIFALPSTVSLFSGQHTWYNLNDQGNQVPCEKCHADINDEMISDDNGHTSLAGPGCDCHRVNSTQVQKPTGVASGDDSGSTPGTTSHAAETIACMVCHEYGNDISGYPHAGGFTNKTGSPYAYNITNRTGTKAAHNAFIQDAIDDPLMEDSNEACIACHTRVGVNITWVKNENLEFTATEGATGDWDVDNFAAGGSNTTQVNYSNTWTP